MSRYHITHLIALSQGIMLYKLFTYKCIGGSPGKFHSVGLTTGARLHNKMATVRNEKLLLRRILHPYLAAKSVQSFSCYKYCDLNNDDPNGIQGGK